MAAQSYGRIVNVTSMNGQVPAMGQANCSASKGGIIAFTQTAAAELVNSGITVNAISPGYTETDMFDAVPPALQTIIKGKIPMGRFAHPEEIAKAVLFLVADGDYITGQQIKVTAVHSCKGFSVSREKPYPAPAKIKRKKEKQNDFNSRKSPYCR
jgi:NAD(P)-dependent dehydrogenase (short-subunit alcohol dehydrogenase family)